MSPGERAIDAPPERTRRRAVLAEADRATFYGGDEKGYTDYPPLSATA
jgi:N-ethylmaleimide reductase